MAVHSDPTALTKGGGPRHHDAEAARAARAGGHDGRDLTAGGTTGSRSITLGLVLWVYKVLYERIASVSVVLQRGPSYQTMAISHLFSRGLGFRGWFRSHPYNVSGGFRMFQDVSRYFGVGG